MAERKITTESLVQEQYDQKVTYKVVIGCPVLFLKLSHRLYEIARIQAKLQLVKTKVN